RRRPRRCASRSSTRPATSSGCRRRSWRRWGWDSNKFSSARRSSGRYPDDVTDRLLELAGVGRRAWPKVAWSADEFAAELEKRGLGDLPAERAADVYLAWACARGDAAALAAFDERFGADLLGLASRAGLPPALVDDVLQDVRSTLFVAKEGEPPRIAQYTGRGELRGWLRVTAVRQAILTSKRLRARRELADAEPLEKLATPLLDLDSELTRVRARDEFRAAFAEALAGLTERERAVLR